MSTENDPDGTDPIETRLRNAGAAWRTANAQAADVDVAALVSAAADMQDVTDCGAVADDRDVIEIPMAPAAAPPHHRGRWIAAAVTAAATVAAVIIGVSVAGSGGGHPTAHDEAAGTAAAGLDGVTWHFVSASPVAAVGSTAPLRVNTAFLSFSGDTVKGNDGCNYLFGKVTVSGSQLTFHDLGSTAMGCLDGDPSRATINAVLSGTVEFTVLDRATLTLTKPGVGTLVYRASTGGSPITDPAVLSGTTWYLDTITTGDTSSGSSDYRRVTLTFDNRGGIVSSDGCNTATAPVTASSGTMSISPLTVAAPRPCPSSAMAQVDTVLTGDVTWSIAGGRLTIAKKGVGALVYVPQSGWTSNPPAPPTGSATAVPVGPSAGASTSAAPPAPTGIASSSASSSEPFGGIAGTSWQLAQITTTGPASGSGSGGPGYARVTLRFDGADRISGSDGCNSFGAKVTIGDGTLTISQFLSTMMACVDPPADPATVHRVLSDGTDTWSLGKDGLLLSRGAVTLSFRPAQGS